MEPTPKTPQPEPESWSATGIRASIVSGAFCLIVLGMLLVNHFQGKASSPLDNPQMAELKKQLSATPNDEKLKLQIRALDLKLRESQHRRVALGNYGAVLLLGGAVAFLLSIKPATNRKKLPKPEKRTAEAYALENVRTRYAVLAVGVVTAGLGLAISNNNETFLAQSTPAAASASAVSAAKPGVPMPAGGQTAKAFPSVDELKKNWPRFRGPFGASIASCTNVPVTWNGTNGQNILWKVEVPLYSPASPVVWGDRIFLSGANATNRAIYAYDTSGKLLWTGQVDPKRANNEPPAVMEDTGGFGPSTPCTDGQRVYAIYANGDIAAFDFNGKQVWARNVGPFENTYGHAASLEMFENRLIVQLDQATAKDNKSKVLALDSATGQTVWETTPRPVPASWATPIVINDGKQNMLITCGNPWVMAYNPTNGTEIWRAKAMYGEVLPSPVCSGGVVYTAIEGEKLRAIKVDGTGDITTNNILWSAEDGLPDITGPLCDGSRVYLINSSGTLTCYNAADGKKLWDKDLELTFKACATLVGDLIYVISDNGTGIVVRAGNEFQEVARSTLGEEVLSSPAVVDNRIYIRSRQHLFCVGVK